MPFIKTEVVITECEPLILDPHGDYATLGALVDARVAAMLADRPSSGPPPRPQSIEIGWETDHDWGEFAMNAREAGLYTAKARSRRAE